MSLTILVVDRDIAALRRQTEGLIDLFMGQCRVGRSRARVLALLALGVTSTKSMCDVLDMTPRSLNRHLSAMMRELRCPSRGDVAVRAAHFVAERRPEALAAAE